MKKVLTGNYAAAFGAIAAKVDVISAYPITPQTTIVEILSEIVANGQIKAEFIKVESEHSALASCIGAQATGARTFTATSAQGLALMHELLHWASRARLPIVIVNVNRAMAPGWSIWADATDSISQRDTGWMQMYCENNQEVFDSILMAYKISEHEDIMLPTLINLDAFFLSHTSQVVDLYNEKTIDHFLPAYAPKIKLDVNNPKSFGALTSPEYYYEFSYKIHLSHIHAKSIIKKIGKEFGDIFGRTYDLIEAYRCDDAEIILVNYGTIAGTTKEAVDVLRVKGISVGSLKIRYFRPFPLEDIHLNLRSAKKIGVIDRAVSYGHAGPFYTEIKACMSDQSIPIYGFIAGLGGRDVSQNEITSMVEYMQLNGPQDLIWIGIKNV